MNNLSPGISLTSQTWFIFLWSQLNFVCSKMLNKVWISIGNWKHFYFTITPLYIPFQKYQEKINKYGCQTYSWNKDGVKLFLFREYGPLWLQYGAFTSESTFQYQIFRPVIGWPFLYDPANHNTSRYFFCGCCLRWYGAFILALRLFCYRKVNQQQQSMFNSTGSRALYFGYQIDA